MAVLHGCIMGAHLTCALLSGRLFYRGGMLVPQSVDLYLSVDYCDQVRGSGRQLWPEFIGLCMGVGAWPMQKLRQVEQQR